MIYILFNPLANNSHGEEEAKKWAAQLKEEKTFQTVINLNFKKFLKPLTEKDEVILCGGDGTINRFANDTYGENFRCKISYAKCGSGNDFYHDVIDYEVAGRVDIKPFLKNLPLITVNGIKQRFLNGIGYGIDGDTCLAGDQIRAKDKNAKINYSKIAVGLLLGKFNTKISSIEVDGKKETFTNTWLATTMKGKYYGGGMMAGPNQNRLNKEGTVDLIVFHGKGRIRTLLRFPKFSGGKHNGKKYIDHFVGKNITVTFSTPCALQIDGEVVENVTTYTVTCDK